MNYIEHLNQYRIARMQNPLSTNAIALYFILLEFNNNLGWIETFTVANSVLMGLSDLSRDGFNRARNELKQKGYVKYTNGSGNQAGKYLIVRFATQTAHKPNTSDTQTEHTTRTLNKQNKTKQNNKEKNIKKESSKKFVPPTLDEVKAYCEERKSNVDPKFFFDYFDVSNWIDGKGNKVQNWKQKLITWERSGNAKHNGKDSRNDAGGSGGESEEPNTPKYGTVY